MAKEPQVAVVMGSDSDWLTMEQCVLQLQELGVRFEVEIMSAHRTPQRVYDYARGAEQRGLKVIIAAAGLSAALAGAIAANTSLPVIGVPVASGPLAGVDALLSTVQMPPGVPVATMGIGPFGAGRRDSGARRFGVRWPVERLPKKTGRDGRQQELEIAGVAGQCLICGSPRRLPGWVTWTAR